MYGQLLDLIISVKDYAFYVFRIKSFKIKPIANNVKHQLPRFT